MTTEDFVAKLRAWARRYEPRSQERTLFLMSADRIESMELRILTARAETITAADMEAAIGAPLLPWQKKRMEAKTQTPPASEAA